MEKQIELLKYLKKRSADIEEQNINEVLKKLELNTETKAYDFLNALEKIKYIEWRDARPRKVWSDPYLIGSSPDKDAPLDYQATITLTGLQFLREDDLKIYNKWTTILAVIIALISGATTWYYSNSAKDKDEEISSLKIEKTTILALQNSKTDSISALKNEVTKIRKLYSDHLKNDSILAQKPVSLPNMASNK